MLFLTVLAWVGGVVFFFLANIVLAVVFQGVMDNGDRGWKVAATALGIVVGFVILWSATITLLINALTPTHGGR